MVDNPKTTAERIILIAGLWLLACDDPAADLVGGPVGPSTGTLIVSTSTVGEDPDPDGYQLRVDDANSRDLNPTGTTEVDLPSGRHTLRLLGVADHCTVTSGNPVAVDISTGSRTPATFEVSCPATGARITTTTTGQDIDRDGYGLVVDGTDSATIPSNGTLLIRLEPGSRTISLAGLASNCAIEGSAAHTLTIETAEVATINFVVVCTSLSAPLAGHIWGQVLAEGGGCIPGAMVEIVAGPGMGRKSGQPDPPACDPWGEEGFTFDDLPLGARVTLRAAASGYQSEDRDVRVPAGGGPVQFILSPDPGTPAGSIQVKVHTAGAPLDPDGYTIVLDNASSGQAAPVNGEVLLTDLAPEDHRVRLEGAADNCWLSETKGGIENVPWSAVPLPPVVSVKRGRTASVTFDLVCVEPGGAAIDVQVERTGDPFSYYTALIISRSDGLTRTVQPGVVHGLTKGSYQVWLTGGTPFHIQCAVRAPNPRDVNLESESVVTTVFQLCINE